MKNNTTAIQFPGDARSGFASFFSIKPYKNRLLTPGARYWIVCVHLIIFVMALSEALSWGYLGSLFASGWIGYVAAAVAFLFMFSIIWVIDVSFVTLDLSRAFYDKAILQAHAQPWLDRTRLALGLIGRIVIVIVSLSISAPFLSQIVFKQDIDNDINRQNLATASAVRDSLLTEKDGEIAAVDSLIMQREADIVQETAGRGYSGNYGIGPVTLTMQQNLQRLRDEKSELIRQRNALEDRLQETSVEELARQYNIALIDNGVQTREAVLNGLMANPQFRTAKRAITAFLAFIFAALVLLKLFQPRSVRIYFNEKLQDLYQEYLSGNLNKWIAREEQATEAGEPRMSPLRFEDWCLNTYSVVRNEDLRRRDGRQIYHLYRMKLEQLEEERDSIRRMLEPLEEKHHQKLDEAHQIEVDLFQVERDIDHLARQEKDLAGQAASIDEDLRNNLYRGGDVLLAVTAKKELELRRAAGRDEAVDLEHRRNVRRHDLDVKKRETADLEALIDKIRTHYRTIQDKIDRERLVYTDLVASGRVFNESEGISLLIPSTVQGDVPDDDEVAISASQADRLLQATDEDQPEEAAPAVDDVEESWTEETSDRPALEAADAEPESADTDLNYDFSNFEWLSDYLQDDEDEATESSDPSLAEDELDESDDWEEDESDVPFASDNAMQEQEMTADDEDPVEFVDDERLRRYADRASLSAYEASRLVEKSDEEDEEEDEEQKEDKKTPTSTTYAALEPAPDEDEIEIESESKAVEEHESPSSFTLDEAEGDSPRTNVPAIPDVQDGIDDSDVDFIEEFLRKRKENASSRSARQGRSLRKGAFNKPLNKGV